MIYTAIAAIILLLNILPLILKSKRARKEAYQWWFVPWLAFVYVIVMGVEASLSDVASWTVFSIPAGMGARDGAVEVCYALLCNIIWMFASVFLRKTSIHNSLIPWFMKAFAP